MSLSLAVRNTSIQLVGRIFSTLFGVIALALITRYLGQERYGWYTTASTFLQFFGVLADFGLTLITAQMISEPGVDEEKIVSNIFTFRLILSIVFFGSASILIWFFPYPSIIKWGVMVLTLSLFAVTLQNIFLGVYQKHLEMSKVAWGDMLGRGLVLVGYLICVWQKWGLLPILFISVIANAAQLFLLWSLAAQYVKVKLICDRLIFKEIFRRSWPLAVSIAFNLIYLRADILILSLIRPQSEVGLYGAAYRIIDVLTSIPAIFMGVMLPLLAFNWVSLNREKFQHYFRRAFDFLSILGWPLFVGGVMLAPQTMVFVAGRDFISAGVYLKILLLALFFIFFGLLASHTVLALNKQKKMIGWYLFDAVLSLIGYLVFIPRYGALAAAWVTVFSEGFIMVANLIMVLKVSKAVLSWKIFLKSLLASLVMLGCVFFLPVNSFLLILILAIIIYFVALFVLKGITKEMVKETLRGR